MQDKVIYEYAILRLVPKVEREEFFNIGVILYAREKKFLQIKYNINTAKLTAFGCDIEQDTLHKYLESWEQITQGKKEAGVIGALDMASRFRWLVAARSTIIQSSKTHSGLCSDPQNELAELFEKHVG